MKIYIVNRVECDDFSYRIAQKAFYSEVAAKEYLAELKANLIFARDKVAEFDALTEPHWQENSKAQMAIQNELEGIFDSPVDLEESFKKFDEYHETKHDRIAALDNKYNEIHARLETEFNAKYNLDISDMRYMTGARDYDITELEIE